MRKKKAFTLVELLVVIAIIALLMGILLPALNRARAVAQRTVCLATLRSFGQANMVYAAANNGKFVPFSRQHVTNTPSPEGVWDERWPENRAFRNILAVNKKIEDTGWNDPYIFPRELLCPSHKTPRRESDILNVGTSYAFKVRMSYAMNTELWAGKAFDDNIAWFPSDNLYRGHFDTRVKRPAESVMFIDGNFYQTRYEKANYLVYWNKYGDVLNEQSLRQVCYRHVERACIVYFDGHTGFLNKEDVFNKNLPLPAFNLQARRPILLWDAEYPAKTAPAMDIK